MLARNHYMVWEYSDVNEPFMIEAPNDATPTGTPAVTPVASRPQTLARAEPMPALDPDR
jgi:hypothetical protein